MSDSKIQKYAPEPVSIARAVVASIPFVGGALDHLIFDKADAIRTKNIEAALSALADRVATLQDSALDKKWFESEEALAVFRLMTEKTAYEPDKEKIKILGSVAAACGTVKHSADPHKLSVIEHLSKLSSLQIKLLSVIAGISPREQTFSNGGLEQKATAVWLSDIADALRAGPQFWSGTMQVYQELEILESLNTIRRFNLFVGNDTGYVITGLGARAASYVGTSKP